MPELKNIFSETHYRLVETIAEGGMGIVYKAEQNGAGHFRKTVAIKLILEELSFFDEFQENFIGEARLVADLIHTNIVQTYHLGEIGGHYFIVMEYVNGLTLADFIQIHRDRNLLIPVDLAVFIASRVCRGLAYAHAKTNAQNQPLGIVHRDINPRNIMISQEGDIKITDFGIAKARDLMHSEEGEEVVFSWITWPSREARDTGNKAAMADPRLDMEMSDMPFDGKRMIFGGFNTIVET